MCRHPLRPTLFPYTTLFRSVKIYSQAAAEALQPPRAVNPAKALIADLDDLDGAEGDRLRLVRSARDRKSTRLNSSHLVISYAVFCLKQKKQIQLVTTHCNKL